MDTKSAIIAATIECIEKHGLQRTTSREIAAAAEVNVAAINYHFGTKQALIERAMQVTIDNGMADFSALMGNADQPLRPRLRAFFTALLHGGLRYPNITRAHLHDAVVNGGPPGPYLDQLGALLQRALDTASPHDTLLDPDDLARACETALHAVLLRCLHPALFSLEPRGATQIDDEVRRLMRLIPE